MAPKSFHKEEIAGKTVIDSMGNVRGKIKDVIFSLDGNVSLIIENTEGSEAKVPLSKVLGISDYIIMKTDVSPDASMPSIPSVPPMVSAPPPAAPAVAYSGFGGPTSCKFCGTPIPADSTYCPGCGRSKL